MRERIKSYVRAFHGLRGVNLEPDIEEKLNIDYILENVTCWERESAENLVKSLAILSNELKDELPHYGTIISDDASGRLISLFFRRLINNKREELGRGPVSTYFLTPRKGRYRKINEAIDEFITEKVDSTGRVLVVTEHIDSGVSLSPIIRSLEKQPDVDFDIATISINEFFSLPESLSKKVKYVSKGIDGLILYNTAFTGVTKDFRGDDLIHPKKKDGADTQRFLRQAREEIGIMADEISSIV